MGRQGSAWDGSQGERPQSLNPCLELTLKLVCWVTMGHLRVTMGHLRVTVGQPWVTIGHLRATMGHLRLTTGYHKATVVHIRVTLGHLKVTLGYFFSELHPKVRQTCPFSCDNML